jgi:hypothetical protein
MVRQHQLLNAGLGPRDLGPESPSSGNGVADSPGN